ncbi:MAG: phosphoribosyltransferase family protein [Pseudomonadota bacterium]
MDKVFISANELMRDSFKLAIDILKTGYRPSYLVGVWRGGTPVGITVQELFEFYGFESNHFAIRTSSYGGGTTPDKNVKVMGLEYLVDTINAEDQLLIVDDVFDSGRSVEAIIKELRRKCRRNTPDDIRVATVYYKPEKNKTDRVPDYYVHQTDAWLVFPHELRGCTLDELKAHKELPGEAFDLWMQFKDGR